MTRLRRLAPVVLGLALVAVLSTASPALAHGRLVDSDPPEGSHVDVTPEQLRIWISETISPVFSTVELQTLSGSVVAVEGIRIEQDGALGLIVVDLPPLEDGTYSAGWTVLSESDGHITRGLVVFGVGEGVTGSAVTDLGGELPAGQAAARWLVLLSVMSIVGAVLLERIVRHDATVVSVRTRAIVRWSAAAGLAASLVLLAVQTAAVRAGMPDRASVLDPAIRLVSSTSWGRMWAIRVGLLAIAFFLAGAALSRPIARRLPMYVVGLGLIFTQSLASHAMGVLDDSALAVTADAAHLLAASVWIGGLLVMAASGGRLGSRSWRRFGNVAAVSVGVLVATGLYATGRQVASLDAAVETPYGRTLFFKIVLVSVVGLLGLSNAMRVHPRLRQWLPTSWRDRLSGRGRPVRRIVLAELAAGILVVGLTGLLTSLEPANGDRFAPLSQAVNAMSDVVGDVTITLAAQPNRPGDNVLIVHAASSIRPAPTPIDRVLVRFVHQGDGLGRRTEEMVEVEPGRFRLGGSQLGRSGPWIIDVVVRRKGMSDAVATFDWLVPAADPVPPLISDGPLAPALTAGAGVLLLIVAAGTAWFVVPRRPVPASAILVVSSRDSAGDEEDTGRPDRAVGSRRMRERIGV